MNDNNELGIEQNFNELENNLKGMEVGLKWFWNKLIYPPLNFVILKPLEKLLNYFFGFSDEDKGDDFF